MNTNTEDELVRASLNSSAAKDAAEADLMTQKARSSNELGLLRELREQHQADSERHRKVLEGFQARCDEQLALLRSISAKTVEIAQEQLAMAHEAVKQAREDAKAARRPEKPSMSGPEAAVDIAKHLITKGAGLLEKVIESDPRVRDQLHHVTRTLLGSEEPAGPQAPQPPAPGAPPAAPTPQPLPAGLTLGDILDVFKHKDDTARAAKALELGIALELLPFCEGILRTVAEDSVKELAAKLSLSDDQLPFAEVIKLARDPANAASAPEAAAS